MKRSVVNQNEAKELASLAQFRTRLRSSGLRATAPRLAVLRHLEAAANPVSHAELTDALLRGGFDRVTIYRNLNDLAEADILERTDLGDHTWRFELRKPGEPAHTSAHPHFTCTDCGTVTCLPDDAIDMNTRTRGLPKAVTKRQVRVTLQGQCDDCI